QSPRYMMWTPSNSEFCSPILDAQHSLQMRISVDKPLIFYRPSKKRQRSANLRFKARTTYDRHSEKRYRGQSLHWRSNDNKLTATTSAQCRNCSAIRTRATHVLNSPGIGIYVATSLACATDAVFLYAGNLCCYRDRYCPIKGV